MSIRSCGSRFALALTLLFLTSPLAALDVWVPLGPDGGTVPALAWAPDGRTAYAGTLQGGVFRSFDGGRSWTSSGKGLRGWVRRIAVDTGEPSTVYAATSEGLFRSLDGGGTWRDVAPREAAVDGLRSALAVVTSSRGTVYASFESYAQGGLFRSLDRGDTWQAVGPGLPGPTLTLAVDPRQHLVFAGTGNGLFQSRDGVAWSPAGLESEAVTDVRTDPHQPGRVLAVGVQFRLGRLPVPAVYIRENGGRWRRSLLGPEGTVFGQAWLAADPVLPGVFYAGVSEVLNESADLYRSTDGGRRWKAVRRGKGIAALVAHPRRRGVLLTGATGSNASDPGPAVLRSADFGVTWSPSDAGLQALELNDFAAGSDALYSLLHCCGLWRSEPGGGAWQRPAGDSSAAGLSLGLGPADPEALYLGAYQGLWKSMDRGATWSRVVRSDETVWDVAADPTTPGTLYFILAWSLTCSHDDGLSWWKLPTAVSRLVTLGPGTPAAAWAQSEPLVQAAGDERGPNRVIRSTDGGVTWETLLTLGDLDESVTAIAPDPADPRRAVVAFTRFAPDGRPMGGGLYRTVDGGATWELSRLPNRRPVYALAIDPRDPERVYAGSFGGVFVSADGGATWTAAGEGLPASQVNHLVFGPDDPGILYAATRGGGIWRLARLE